MLSSWRPWGGWGDRSWWPGSTSRRTRPAGCSWPGSPCRRRARTRGRRPAAPAGAGWPPAAEKKLAETSTAGRRALDRSDGICRPGTALSSTSFVRLGWIRIGGFQPVLKLGWWWSGGNHHPLATSENVSVLWPQFWHHELHHMLIKTVVMSWLVSSRTHRLWLLVPVHQL